MFPTQYGPKEGDALSPQLFNDALEYAIEKVQERQLGLKLNGKHQLLSYAELLGDNVRINTINKNTEARTDAGKEAGLDLNTEKTKYEYSHQNARHHYKIKISNRSSESVARFKYLGITASQNLCHEEIKGR
jgi:hypothetical protein